MLRSLVLSLLLVLSLPAVADLDRLQFMLGRWQSDNFGQGAEEFWTGGDTSMAGLFRGVLPDGRVITEFILVEQGESGITMRWNHFNEDYSRWENDPIEHHLVESRSNYANFEMAETVKGLPKNLVYSRSGNELKVWVGDLGATDQGGAFELTFYRVGD